MQAASRSAIRMPVMARLPCGTIPVAETSTADRRANGMADQVKVIQGCRAARTVRKGELIVSL